MIDLEWHEAPHGYTSGDYRIRITPGRSRTPWQLDLSESARRSRAWQAFTISYHSTLNDAKDRARRVERERRIRVRTIGHAIVGVVASVAFVMLVPGINGIPEFVLALTALFVALRSFAFAVSVKLGDAWGWTRDSGTADRITWSDRAVFSIMERLRRRTMNAIDDDESRVVKPLPPEPPS